MKFKAIDPPRAFSVGVAEIIQLKDCARVELAPNEQITLTTEQQGEFDIVRKSWGFYATPSLNGRLPQFGLRALLVRSPSGWFFVLLVEKGKEPELHAYLQLENHQIITWLDNDQDLETLAGKLAATR